jgi:hypothetical protein
VEEPVLLSADRLDVIAGERIRTALIVSTVMVTVLSAGGVESLRRELEDVGFRDVRVFVDRPDSWRGGSDVPRPDGLEWLLFAELVPKFTASFQRQLTEQVRVADAWDARLDGIPPLPLFHPYAVALCVAARFAGAVHGFAIAYPIEVLSCCR